MRILPRPQKVERLSGEFVINDECKVYSHSNFLDIATQFVKMVDSCNGTKLQFVDDVTQSQICFVEDADCPSEGYVLNIAHDGLTVSASTAQGCYYAFCSLCQIFDLFLPHQVISCICYYVEDYPRFTYRGLHFDICRHFYGVDVIKQIIHLMSQVKLNKLHLHLTDDQGWRIQIDKYPKLTEISSNRAGTEVVENGSRYVVEEPYGGYLTKQDVAELVAYAKAHYVDIIPEIDLPGHMVAALAAYPEYSCTGKVTEVRKTWGISKDVLCAGNEETYQFVCDVLDEVCQMFPYEYIHIGGDEAPRERWCNCKKCVEKMAELKYDDFAQLQNYMMEFFATYLQQIGKKVICWNDGIQRYTSLDIISQVWQPFTFKESVKQANNGRKTIMSPFFNMYFDYPYAMTPLKRTLHFNPTKGVKSHALANVLGVEGAVWTEYIGSLEKLFFNLLPRLDALANCGWSNTTKKFSEALQGRLAYYDSLGLTYNHRAMKQRRNVCATKKFFKVDANVELKAQQKRLGKSKFSTK